MTIGDQDENVPLEMNYNGPNLVWETKDTPWKNIGRYGMAPTLRVKITPSNPDVGPIAYEINLVSMKDWGRPEEWGAESDFPSCPDQ